MKAFFAKIWTATKAFFAKVWSWSLANKVIAISIASTVVVGTTCAIVLPIALHEHSYATEWSSDADNHWHDATCKHEEEKSGLAAHTYANTCDTTCDVCGYTRTVGAHAYDNACDTSCNVCGATRTVDPHVYDNGCDTDCNECGATRTITHDHADTLTAGETTHWYACSVCGDKKDEAAHVFDKTVASSEYLKAAATATTKAQYYKSCVCGAKSDSEYFETDKAVATLTDIQDLSKTYDKLELQNPTYVTNSDADDAVVTFEWYQGATKLDAKPVNAGTYKVKVTIPETATYTGVSAEEEFTIAKKTLNYLNLTKVYDGKAGYNDSVFFLDTTHGLVAGDVVSIETNDDVEYNVGTYTLTDVSGQWELDDCIYLEGADAANYAFNYQSNGAVATVTVTPIILNITYNFEYNGIEFDGIASRQAYLTSNEHPDILAGDEVLLEAEFLGADVGANVTNENFEPGISDTYGNYATGTCNLAIVPKVLYNVELHVTYAKTTAFSNVAVPVSAGVAEGDDYKVGIDLLGVKAGEYTIANELLEDIYPEACEDLNNYSIDRATVKVVVDKRELKDVIYNLTYGQYFTGDSYASGSCPIAYPLKTTHNVFEGDTVYLSTTFESRNAGAAVLSQGIFGADADNYTLPEDVLVDIKIAPRFLTVPNMISKEYDGNGHFSYTYPVSQAYGEVVTVEFDIESGAIGAYRNAKISNLKFYVGGVETTNYTWAKDPINAFINNGEFSEAGTLSVGADFTKGLYSLTLTESGLYSFTGSENFFTVDGIYNQYGNTIALDGLTFAAPSGTYMVEISKTSNFTPGATVSVAKESISFANEKLFDCQQAEEKTLTLTKGEFLCLKVMGGVNSLMSDLYINVPEGSNALFFAMEYSLDQSECYWVYQNSENGIGIPHDSYYMDVCETSDLYIVLYAITSGDIIVTVD